MGSEFGKIKEIGHIMAQHGRDIIIALALVVVGLIIIKWINQGLKRGLSKLPLSSARASVVRNIVCVIILAIVAIMASIEIGLPPRPVLQILTIITLAAAGVIACAAGATELRVYTKPQPLVITSLQFFVEK